MRAIMILAILAATAPAWIEANAQPSNSQPAAPQASPPNVSSPNDSPATSGNAPRGSSQAPVGHRQPRAGEVPDQGNNARSQADEEIDSKLRICRGC
jgi:hypothetical protein